MDKVSAVALGVTLGTFTCILYMIRHVIPTIYQCINQIALKLNLNTKPY